MRAARLIQSCAPWLTRAPARAATVPLAKPLLRRGDEAIPHARLTVPCDLDRRRRTREAREYLSATPPISVGQSRTELCWMTSGRLKGSP